MRKQTNIREPRDNFPVELPLWVPKTGQTMVVELPGERLLVSVAKVVSPDIVIVELTSTPMSKTHQHKKGEYVPCERFNNGLETVWREYNMLPKAAMPKIKVPEEAPKKRKRSVGIKDAVKAR